MLVKITIAAIDEGTREEVRCVEATPSPVRRSNDPASIERITVQYIVTSEWNALSVR